MFIFNARIKILIVGKKFRVHIDRLVSILLLKMAKQLVSVTVVCNNRCLVPWAVIPAEATDRFSGLLDSMKAEKYGTIRPDVLLDQAEHIEIVLVGRKRCLFRLLTRTRTLLRYANL